MKNFVKNMFLKIFLKIKYFIYIYMSEYKNRIAILRNIIQKSNDRHLIDYVFKKNFT